MKKELSLIAQNDSVIISLQRASTALAEAKTIQHTKKIIDVSAAAEIYAKRQHLGEAAVAMATSIKVEALRKLGEMLKATPKAKGGQPFQKSTGTKVEPVENQAETLAELGIDKKTSSVAQALANLSDDAFEEVREGNETVAKALAKVKAKRKPRRKLLPRNLLLKNQQNQQLKLKKPVSFFVTKLSFAIPPWGLLG